MLEPKSTQKSPVRRSLRLMKLDPTSPPQSRQNSVPRSRKKLEELHENERVDVVTVDGGLESEETLSSLTNGNTSADVELDEDASKNTASEVENVARNEGSKEIKLDRDILKDSIVMKENMINETQSDKKVKKKQLRKEINSLKTQFSEIKLMNGDESPITKNSTEIDGTNETTTLDSKINDQNGELLTDATVETKKDDKEDLPKDVDDKIDRLLLNVSGDTGSEDEKESNPFLDSMAEEGEEDTPSEGSNDIIEVGEEINTTESDISTDESYEDNSFIDDEENHQLLSGEEYDLSLEDTGKRRRIIEVNFDSDEEIVQVKKNKKKAVKKQRKSRIIRMKDSSDENEADEVVNNEEKQNLVASTPITSPYEAKDNKIIILENIRVQDNKDLSEKVNNILSCLYSGTVSRQNPSSDVSTEGGQNEPKETQKRERNTNEPPVFVANKNYFKFRKQVTKSGKKNKKRKRPVDNSPFVENKLEYKRRKQEPDVTTEQRVNDGWEEQKVIVKPSINTKPKEQNIEVNRFHAKDFKGLMLYDQKRVKREKTSRYF